MLKVRVAVLALSLVFLFHSPVPGLASTEPVQQTKVEGKVLDQRAQILQAYLAHYDSPLQYQAQDFVDAADKYNLDWKLVPAISGVESTFGKQTPGGFNGWGWGVYGDQAIYFNSWKDGIYTVSAGLRDRYLNRGLNDPLAMNQVYAASPTWGAHVNYFLNDLSRFERQYKGIAEQNSLAMVLDLNKIPTSTSAQLASQLP